MRWQIDYFIMLTKAAFVKNILYLKRYWLNTVFGIIIMLPDCPDCADCALSKNCQTKPNFNIALRLADKMNKQINQLELRNLFISR